MTADALDVYAIACLAGGTQRVVDTALVALVESGRVRVGPAGELVTVSSECGSPVEAAVLDAVGPGDHGSVDAVRWRLTTDERILDVPRRLRDLGLLEAGGPAPAARRSRWRLTPTYAGRHLLHELRDAAARGDRTVDGTTSASAMTVALHGCERMADRTLCAVVLGQAAPTVTGVEGRHPASA